MEVLEPLTGWNVVRSIVSKTTNNVRQASLLIFVARTLIAAIFAAYPLSAGTGFAILIVIALAIWLRKGEQELIEALSRDEQTAELLTGLRSAATSRSIVKDLLGSTTNVRMHEIVFRGAASRATPLDVASLTYGLEVMRKRSRNTLLLLSGMWFFCWNPISR